MGSMYALYVGGPGLILASQSALSKPQVTPRNRAKSTPRAQCKSVTQKPKQNKK